MGWLTRHLIRFLRSDTWMQLEQAVFSPCSRSIKDVMVQMCVRGAPEDSIQTLPSAFVQRVVCHDHADIPERLGFGKSLFPVSFQANTQVNVEGTPRPSRNEPVQKPLALAATSPPTLDQDQSAFDEQLLNDAARWIQRAWLRWRAHRAPSGKFNAERHHWITERRKRTHKAGPVTRVRYRPAFVVHLARLIFASSGLSRGCRRKLRTSSRDVR
jgi:hypothetical protein